MINGNLILSGSEREPLLDSRSSVEMKRVRESARVEQLFQTYEQNNRSISPTTANHSLSNARMISIKQKTEYVDNHGNLLSDADINRKITEKIRGIYSVDSVTVNKTNFEFGGSLEKKVARKIQIIRTWCLYDLVPLGVFLPTLFDKNSVYHKPINTNSIQDFILGAKPKKYEIDVITTKLQTSFSEFSLAELRQMKELTEFKYENDEPYEISSTDRAQPANFITKFERYIEEFKNEYAVITLEGRNHLLTAFWKSKSLTIYIPEEIQDNNLEAYIEVPKDSGVTPIAISMAISLRSLFTKD